MTNLYEQQEALGTFFNELSEQASYEEIVEALAAVTN